MTNYKWEKQISEQNKKNEIGGEYLSSILRFIIFK